MIQIYSRALPVILVVAVSAAAAYAQQQRGDWWGHGPMRLGHMSSDQMHGWGWGNMGPGQEQRMQRHWTYMNEGVPAAYRGSRSAVRATPKVVAEGRALYSENCASCHGNAGLGDGEAGRSLVPSPALLRWFVQMPMSGDEYLLWTVSKVGERFGTNMPAFKGKLTEDDIWKIIAYMRAGFP